MNIVLSLPPKELGPNGAKGKWRQKAIATKAYREEAKLVAMEAAYKQGVRHPFEHPVVSITYYHKTKTFMDCDNVIASLKSAFDGLQDAGVFVNDRDVIYLPVERAKDAENPRVELTIYENTPAAYELYLQTLKDGNE